MTAPTATVRVRVTVEVSLRSLWGHDCTIGQAHSQATVEARTAIHNALASDSRFRVVSVDACDVVLHREGKP